jgi:hypothetical protein
LYLRGRHLDVLRRFNCPYADGIRLLIERATTPLPAEPESPDRPAPAVAGEKKPEAAAPLLCEYCATRFGEPVCYGSRAAFYGDNPPPLDWNKFLCERCKRIGVPSCRECIYRTVS